MTNQELGIYGESIAVNYLKNKQFEIVKQNFRFGKLELDIVCRHEGILKVVEVKTRQTAEIGEPWKAVTRAKQRQIIKATQAYIEQENWQGDTQFDIISIVHNSYRTDIEHLEDAFYPTM